MEQMIPIANQLLNLESSYPEIPISIPKIVVVGEQSAGKSSVLERLIGRSILPRGTEIVTRCPIVVKLILEKQSPKKAENAENPEKSKAETKTGALNYSKVVQSQGLSMENKNEEEEEKEDEKEKSEWCEFLHKPNLKFYNFDDVRDEIQNVVDARAGTNKGIVQDEVSLTIHSPNVINLTLIDLPGIVESPVGDQPADIKQQVRDLLKKYIQQKNCIILAVSAATSDIATSQSIQLAEQVDPQRKRTVAVRTKLDLVDEGTEEVVRRTLMGMSLKVPFQKGIVGVVNQSQKDINNNQNIQDSIKSEEAFFAKNYPDLKENHGILYLRQKLQQILIEKIQSCLPQLESKNREDLKEVRIDLASLGEESDEERIKALRQITFSIFRNFLDAVSLTHGGPIREIFENVLPTAINQIDPEKDLKTKYIQKILKDFEGVLSFKNLPMNSFQKLSTEQIRRLHSAELNCARLCVDEFEKLVQNLLNDEQIRRFPSLKSTIDSVVQKVLDECFTNFKKILWDFIEVKSTFADSGNDEFEVKITSVKSKLNEAPHRIMDLTSRKSPPQYYVRLGDSDEGVIPPQLFKSSPSPSDHELDQPWIVRQLVSAYVEEVKAEFTKYCKQAAMCTVIKQLEENLHPNSILQPEIIHTLAQESPGIAEKRKAAQHKLKGLLEHKKIIEELRNARINV